MTKPTYTSVGVVDAMLPRKTSKLQVKVDRTPNRHRWSGREYQGARENSGEGTRQNGTVTSGEGAPLQVTGILLELVVVEDTRWLRLFTKNTALCKLVRGRIGCDACPVLEG